jgi:hypothetical protein
MRFWLPNIERLIASKAQKVVLPSHESLKIEQLTYVAI